MGLRQGVNPVMEALNGAPTFLGVIAVTTSSIDNVSTGVPFNATGNGLGGKILLIQSDADVYVLPVVSGGTVTVLTGIFIGASERVILTMDSARLLLAGIVAGGTANLRVWELL